MSDKAVTPKRPNQCEVCIDPTSNDYSTTGVDCPKCIITLLDMSTLTVRTKDTRGQLISVTEIILRLRKALHWATNERIRLKELNVREFLAKYAKKGNE